MFRSERNLVVPRLLRQGGLETRPYMNLQSASNLTTVTAITGHGILHSNLILEAHFRRHNLLF